jgi:putative nucleotidyltransferase with HDIG domain
MGSFTEPLRPGQALPGIETRKTIGMLIDWIDNQYQFDLLYGIAEFAEEKDINLLFFEGGVIDDKNQILNKVYDLAGQNNVDGLIILSASIGRYSSREFLTQFCKKYSPLPTVIVGLQIPGLPSLSVDNNGIRELIRHLILAHGYRRFAFIKGAESSLDTIERFDAFLKTLAEYNIPMDPGRIIQGDYTYNSGVEAIRELIDRRKMDFDVVVACNDDMALGALNELAARGIKTPGEAAVVGFDNIDSGGYSSPPLTTIGYSIYELGRRAAEVLLDLLAHKEVPMFEVVPTKMVIRESCGCHSRLIENITPCRLAGPNTLPGVDTGIKASPLAFLTFNQEMITSGICAEVQHLFADTQRINPSKIVAQLCNALYQELIEEKNGIFDKAWNEILDFGLRIYKDISVWQMFISLFRRHLLPYFANREILLVMEDILHQARISVDLKALELEMREHQTTIQIKNSLNSLTEKLLFASDEQNSMNDLAYTLSGLGIRSCYLVLFEEKRGQKSRLVLAYDEFGRKDKNSKVTFPSHIFLPGHILPKERRFTMLVGALNFTVPQLGFVVFEMGPREGKIYLELRRIVSSTLQVNLFLKKIQEQADRLRAQKENLVNNLAESRKVMSGFINAIALTVETRDPYTAGHQQRVADLASAIAVEMRLSPEQVEGVRMAAIIHDLGKIYIPAEILNKPSRLNELEFTFIKLHSEVGYNILKDIDFPWPIAQIILQHHEKLDGSGYPYGLKAQDINLEARILAVADVVEAMMSHRPYRAALDLDEALGEIEAKQGLFYDPIVVGECIELFRHKGFRFNS